MRDPPYHALPPKPQGSLHNRRQKDRKNKRWWMTIRKQYFSDKARQLSDIAVITTHTEQTCVSPIQTESQHRRCDGSCMIGSGRNPTRRCVLVGVGVSLWVWP